MHVRQNRQHVCELPGQPVMLSQSIMVPDDMLLALSEKQSTRQVIELRAWAPVQAIMHCKATCERSLRPTFAAGQPASMPWQQKVLPRHDVAHISLCKALVTPNPPLPRAY